MLKLYAPGGVLLLLIAALTSCDQRTRLPKEHLAARVNGTEISAFGFGKAPGAGDLAELEGLIDQELLVQQAEAAGLDRDPAVRQEIETARHDILSRAVIDRDGGSPPISQADVAEYYRAHPRWFARRRLFRLNELIVPADAAMLAEIKRLVASGKQIGHLSAWLTARKVSSRHLAFFRAAEQLPDDVLLLVADLPPGEAVVIEQAGTIHVIQVSQAIDASMTLEEASQAIERVLEQARRATRTSDMAGQLRGKARIEYLGAFATAHADARGLPKPDSNPADSRSDLRSSNSQPSF